MKPVGVGIGQNNNLAIAQTGEVGTARIDTDGNGNVVELAASGQYAIGTFIADGDIQTLSLAGTQPSAFPAHITAYQVRLVPEPATMALLGLGSLLGLRRRK